MYFAIIGQNAPNCRYANFSSGIQNSSKVAHGHGNSVPSTSKVSPQEVVLSETCFVPVHNGLLAAVSRTGAGSPYLLYADHTLVDFSGECRLKSRRTIVDSKYA